MNPTKQIINSKNFIDFKNMEDDFEIDDDSRTVVRLGGVLRVGAFDETEYKKELLNLRKLYRKFYEKDNKIDEVAIVSALSNYMFDGRDEKRFDDIYHELYLALSRSEMSGYFQTYEYEIYCVISQFAPKWWKADFEKQNQEHTMHHFCEFYRHDPNMIRKRDLLFPFSVDLAEKLAVFSLKDLTLVEGLEEDDVCEIFEINK